MEIIGKLGKNESRNLFFEGKKELKRKELGFAIWNKPLASGVIDLVFPDHDQSSHSIYL